MTDSVEIPVSDFFESKGNSQELDRIIQRCLAERKGVTAHFGIETVTVAIDRNATAKQTELSGRWRAQGFDPSGDLNAGARVFLPLLFHSEAVFLPHDHIYAVARDHQPVAAFFARSLFLALLIGAPVVWKQTTGVPQSDLVKRHFQRQYFWIMKGKFPEKIFDTRPALDVMDLILVNTFFPVIDLESSLLQQGAELLRKNRSAGADMQTSTVKARLRKARTAMMPYLDK